MEPIGDAKRNEHLAALWPLAASESREQQANNTQLLLYVVVVFVTRCQAISPSPSLWAPCCAINGIFSPSLCVTLKQVWRPLLPPATHLSLSLPLAATRTQPIRKVTTEWEQAEEEHGEHTNSAATTSKG